jgi:Tfp pilus assembly protein PilX
MSTTMRGRALTRLRDGSDEGMSLVMVVTSFALLFAIVLTTSLYVVRSLRQAAEYTDQEKALSAAESGIADYLSRAGASSGYWQETDCTNAALETPVAAGETSPCPESWDGKTVGWAAVDSGADASSSPAYHYEVLGWDEQNGSEATSVSLRVTGRSGDAYRTVEVQATRESTAAYTGYQNHWARAGSCTDADGARVYQRSTGMYTAGSALPAVYCLRTLNSSTSGNNGWASNGTEIGSGSNAAVDWVLNPWVNQIEGDFFSNDIAFLSPGPVSMKATYSVNGTLSVVNPWCSELGTTWASSVISTSCDVLPTTGSNWLPTSAVTVTEEPELSASKTLPYDTSALEEAPGCRYYGPTRIVLQDDGTMKVWSKQSVYADMTLAVATAAGDTPDCGTPGALGSDEGATVDLPDGMVVYVQDVPEDVVTTNGIVNGRLDAHEIGGDATYGYLPTGDVAADVLATATANVHNYILLDSSTWTSNRYRTKGNLWVEGEVRGTVTLGSTGSVLVTGDLVTVDSTDQLGIVASQVSVVDQRVAVKGRATLYADGTSWVGSTTVGSTPFYQYIGGSDASSGSVGSWPHSYDGNSDQLRIDAAIQVIAGGFGYQDYEICPLSTGTFGGVGGTGGYGWIYNLDYFDFPYVTYDSSAGWATVPELTNNELMLDVLVTGSLAENYLGTTGVRVEVEKTRGYQTSIRYGLTVGAGSCGINLTVAYDDRLQASTPPYLLQFTDVGWERGASTEVTTPASVRS